MDVAFLFELQFQVYCRCRCRYGRLISIPGRVYLHAFSALHWLPLDLHRPRIFLGSARHFIYDKAGQWHAAIVISEYERPPSNDNTTPNAARWLPWTLQLFLKDEADAIWLIDDLFYGIQCRAGVSLFSRSLPFTLAGYYANRHDFKFKAYHLHFFMHALSFTILRCWDAADEIFRAATSRCRDEAAAHHYRAIESRQVFDGAFAWYGDFIAYFFKMLDRCDEND